MPTFETKFGIGDTIYWVDHTNVWDDETDDLLGYELEVQPRIVREIRIYPGNWIHYITEYGYEGETDSVFENLASSDRDEAITLYRTWHENLNWDDPVRAKFLGIRGED